MVFVRVAVKDEVRDGLFVGLFDRVPVSDASFVADGVKVLDREFDLEFVEESVTEPDFSRDDDLDLERRLTVCDFVFV
jgi:hypothetical protein